MNNRTNWRYIAKYMRAKGYTIEAIEGTLSNMGKTVSPRTIYRVTEGVKPVTVEFNESLTKPLSMYSILTEVLEYDTSWDSEEDCQNETVLSTISREENNDSLFSLPELDLSGSPVPPGFSVYSPTGRRTGLQSYLYRCAEQDRRMQRLPEW